MFSINESSHDERATDRGGHVAEVLPGGSGQRDVHGVPVQRLRGPVLPRHLRVSFPEMRIHPR